MAQSKSKNAKTTAKKNTKAAPKTDTKAKKPKLEEEEPLEPPRPIRREVMGVVFVLLALFTAISYFNTDGVFIRHFSDFMKQAIGYGFWLLVPDFVLIAYIFFTHRGRPIGGRVTAGFLLPLLAASILHLMLFSYPSDMTELPDIAQHLWYTGEALKSGGAIGGLLAYGLESALSSYGAMPVLLVAFILLFIYSTDISISGIKQKYNSRPKYDPARYGNMRQATDSVYQADIPLESEDTGSTKRSRLEREKPAFNVDIPLGDDIEEIPLINSLKSSDYTVPETPKRTRINSKKEKAKSADPTAEVEPMSAEDAAAFAGVVDMIRNMPVEEIPPVSAKPAPKKIADTPKPAETPKKTRTAAAEIFEPPKTKRIPRNEVKNEAESFAADISTGIDPEGYRFPPVSLLRSGESADIDAREEIRINRERLETALHSFGINARIANVIHGPTVTRYDIELEQGVKLARITNLSGDLALSLGVVNVRIAPIPDKISTVGIEVPNKIVSTVYLRDIIDSQKFMSAKSKISFAIGKDISGEGVVGNIAKLPHLLIAGTTGSGKSVCMNSLILSLLYKAKPDEVKLIMIDPKMVELGIYNGIPHLYTPVVTDPKKAAGALQWSVVEMLKRYRLFADVGVRDIEHYNIHCRNNDEPTIPQVVIVIDELADLMLVASKDVEESICRVAQMGRAAGMHLVIATQRPSADVITGLMKANIPSRIAFAVSSAMESRIILDQGGAEKLIGMGDMLFSPIGSGKPTRIQGAFVTDDEREDVIMFIKENCGSAETNSELVEYMEASKESKDQKDSGEEQNDALGDYDEMLPQAVEVVIEMKACSVSMLQRRVKLGYSRAARIVDQMEELGVVGPYEGAKPRTVLVDMAGWHAIQVRLGMIEDDGMSGINETYSDDNEYGEDF